MRRWWPSLALLAATVVLVLLVAEVLVRTFVEVSPPLRVRDPDIGEHYSRSFDRSVWSDEGNRHVRLRFNRFGFRGPDWRDKPSGTRRVAVLGDSMIAALAVEEADTLVERLDARLGDGWEVMNFGVSASSPGQALVLYEKRVASLSPDVVIVSFFVGNDLSDSSTTLDHYPRVYFDFDEHGTLVELPRVLGRAHSSGWLNRHSRFYVWQKHVVNRALHGAAEKARQLPPGWWIYSDDPPPEVDHAWQIVEALFARWREVAEADGVRLLVAVLPSGRQIYADAFEPVRELAGAHAGSFEPEHADERLEALCRAAQVTCVFMSGAFRAASAEREPLFFDRTGHFTERGHDLAAERLYAALTSTTGDATP